MTKSKVQSLIQSSIFWSFLLSLVTLFGSLTLLRDFGYLQFLELAAYDVLVSTVTLKSQWDPPITIVNIDETDIQRLRDWPLSDERMADAIESMLSASPRAIGIDIFRDLPRPPGTERLHNLLTKHQNIIVVEKLSNKSGQGIRAPKPLEGSEQVGFADLAIDAGAVVRRNLLFQTVTTEAGDRVDHYSFALRLALAYLAVDDIYPEPGESNPDWLRLGKTTIPPLSKHDGGYANMQTGGYQILLEYINGMDPFPHLALQDLFDKKLDLSLLRDRIVILGADSEGVKDRFSTPHTILGQPQLAGSCIHAQATRQLLEMALNGRRVMATWPHVWERIWLFIWIVLGLLLSWRDNSFLRSILDMLLGSTLLISGCVIIFNLGWWIPLVPPLLGWYGAMGLGTFIRFGELRTEKKALMGLFERHVSPQVAKTIWENRDEVLENGRIRPQVLPVTILFSDLQGFTKISESMPPEPFLAWLNIYLGGMTEVIMQYQGVLDDYAGDGIKANFGVPLARTDPAQIAQDARQAVNCALALIQTLNKLNYECRISGHPNVGMRIGIHSGQVVVGTVGSNYRMKYTTVGSAVNLASRLESIKEIPSPNLDSETTSGRILISGATAKLLGEGYNIVRQGCFELKGIQHETEVFSIELLP